MTPFLWFVCRVLRLSESKLLQLCSQRPIAVILNKLLVSNISNFYLYIARFAHLRSRTTIQKEINLAIILMFIVIVFLFCNIPRILINCYDFMVNNDFVRQVKPKILRNTLVAVFENICKHLTLPQVSRWLHPQPLDPLHHQLQPPLPCLQWLHEFHHLLCWGKKLTMS